jgi:hypothetical protein
MNNHTEKMAGKLAAMHMQGKEITPGYYTENTLIKLHELLGPQSFKYFLKRNTVITNKQGNEFITDLGHENTLVVSRHISSRRLIINTKDKEGIVIEDVLFWVIHPEFVVTSLDGNSTTVQDVVSVTEIKEISYRL